MRALPVVPSSQCLKLESEITKKEYGNFCLPHEFSLNNISSSFLFFSDTSSRLYIKITSLRRFKPDLQGHLASIQACTVSKLVIFCTEKYRLANTLVNPMVHN